MVVPGYLAGFVQMLTSSSSSFDDSSVISFSGEPPRTSTTTVLLLLSESKKAGQLVQVWFFFLYALALWVHYWFNIGRMYCLRIWCLACTVPIPGVVLAIIVLSLEEKLVNSSSSVDIDVSAVVMLFCSVI